MQVHFHITPTHTPTHTHTPHSPKNCWQLAEISSIATHFLTSCLQVKRSPWIFTPSACLVYVWCSEGSFIHAGQDFFLE